MTFDSYVCLFVVLRALCAPFENTIVVSKMRKQKRSAAQRLHATLAADRSTSRIFNGNIYVSDEFVQQLWTWQTARNIFFVSPKNGMFFGSVLSRALENQPESELTFKRRRLAAAHFQQSPVLPPPEGSQIFSFCCSCRNLSPTSRQLLAAVINHDILLPRLFVLLLNAFFIMLKIISRLELKMCYFYAALLHSALIETDSFSVASSVPTALPVFSTLPHVLRSCCFSETQEAHGCLRFLRHDTLSDLELPVGENEAEVAASFAAPP